MSNSLQTWTARQLCSMPYGDNPDNILFDPVEEAIRRNNHLAVVAVGKFREGAPGLRVVRKPGERFFRLMPKRNRR